MCRRAVCTQRFTANGRYRDVILTGSYYSGYADLGLEDGDWMVGSIVNIKVGNESREYAAAGYIELSVNGESYMLYTDAVVRSPRSVAQKYYDDRKDTLSTDDLNVLKSFGITVD